MLTRRNFIRATLAASFTAAATTLYTWKIEPHWLEVVQRPMAVRHLPAELVGKTVMQISDLHIGARVDSHYLIDSLQQAQALAPDFVFYTGDFVSYDSERQYEQLEQVMRYAAHGRLGTAAVLGNHDYAHGWSNNAVATEISRRLGLLGIPVLRNETRELSGLQVMGIDDYWSTNFRPEVAIAMTDFSRPTIALCHNPDAVDWPVWGAFDGWILAGHTHGGQCKPPFLPPPILPVQNSRYTAGVFEVGGGRTLYINRGLGYLMPVRFNVRPEITLFTLTAF